MAPSATTTTNRYASIDVNEQSLRISRDNSNDKERAKSMIKGVLTERVESIDTDICGAGDEDAFFVADMGEVYRQHLRWKKNLKRVKPHYGLSLSLPIAGKHTDNVQL